MRFPRSIVLISALTTTACAFNQGSFLNQLEKLEGAEYSKIKVGEMQNYTAVKRRVFDKNFVELSNTDDPGVQARFSNQGDQVYYSDNTADVVLKFASRAIPKGVPPVWDRFFVLDGAEATNYVSPGEHTDFLASIVDDDSTVRYRDSAIDLVLRRRPLQPEMDPKYDALFTTDDDRYGIGRWSAAGQYRLFFVPPDAAEPLTFDFLPLAWGLQSVQTGSYLGVVYDLRNRQWRFVNFLPTQKLICFDLARAFEVTAKAADRAVSQAVLNGILTALAGYKTVRYSGVMYSAYYGYYSGRSTTNYTGYAQVYDYRYLAAGAVTVLDAAFAGSAAIADIENAMREQNCGLEF